MGASHYSPVKPEGISELIASIKIAAGLGNLCMERRAEQDFPFKYITVLNLPSRPGAMLERLNANKEKVYILIVGWSSVEIYPRMAKRSNSEQGEDPIIFSNAFPDMKVRGDFGQLRRCYDWGCSPEV